MIIHPEIQSVLDKKETICSAAYQELEGVLVEENFNQEKCRRDLNLIFDAVMFDLKYETTKHITTTGVSYIKFHNGYSFHKQKRNVIIAIDILRNTLILQFRSPKLKALVDLKLDLLCTILNDSTVEEVKWWDWAAKVLPLVALSIIVFSWIYDYHKLTELSIIVTAVVFFTAGVVWWWWALRKIGLIFINTRRTQENFSEIQQEILQIREKI